MIKVAEKKVNDDILKWREYSVTSAEIKHACVPVQSGGYRGAKMILLK
jgi:hypothetical protein